MQMVLPKHLTADRLIKIALVAVSKTPKLMECSQESILQSVMTAAQLGLDCGGALGSAYLVPFVKNSKDKSGNWHRSTECQLIIGYRGMIDLARRSGQIVSIESRIVWEHDVFEIEYGMEMKLRHVPTLDEEPGKFRLVYAVAHLRDGGTQLELMTKAQIDAVRSRSMAKDNGPWVTDYAEMARKTVVKRLFKYLPVSIELAEAVDVDNTSEFGANQFGDGIDISLSPTKQLNERLQATKQIESNVDTDTGEVTPVAPASQPAATQPAASSVADDAPAANEVESGADGDSQLEFSDSLPDHARKDSSWIKDIVLKCKPGTMTGRQAWVAFCARIGPNSWDKLEPATQDAKYQNLIDGSFVWKK
jgi:recombination protein RecT